MEFGPLPASLGIPANFVPSCPRCPPFTPLEAGLVRYPPPQRLADGAAFTIELLRNPATGEGLSDLVRVRLLGQERTRPAGGPLPERFRVEADLQRGAKAPIALVGRFRFIAVGSTEPVHELTLEALPGQEAVIKMGGLNERREPREVQVWLKADPAAGVATYRLEVSEGEEVVHAERVTFPWAP